MGELADGWSLAVAVGLGDRRQVTCDIFFMFFCGGVGVLVLLSAHIRRFSVSCMRGFLLHDVHSSPSLMAVQFMLKQHNFGWGELRKAAKIFLIEEK